MVQRKISPRSPIIKPKSRTQKSFNEKIPMRQSSTQSEDRGSPKKTEQVVTAFSQVWDSLFSSPIHLDSVLSKQSTQMKGILAQIVPRILLAPASLGESIGIGIPPGEPWSLSQAQKSKWRPSVLIAENLYTSMSQKWPDPVPLREDFPPEMIEEWEKSWGLSVVDELTAILGKAPPLSLRASSKLGSQRLIEELQVQGKLPVRAEISKIVPNGVSLSGYFPVMNTDIYRSGGFEIQDEGSQLMALFALFPEKYAAFLSPKPGSVKFKKIETLNKEEVKSLARFTVIDACAGAGGKSLAWADAMSGKGRIYSYDTSEKKLQALKRRAVRMGFNSIQTVRVEEGNEQNLINKFIKSADRVLVDAPCTGWGVLRRNPDIKWRQSSDTLQRLPEVQFRLLAQYSELVAPGGVLTYGVCTFRRAETIDIVNRFVKEFPQFQAREGGYLGPGPCDGFYMQSFIRK